MCSVWPGTGMLGLPPSPGPGVLCGHGPLGRHTRSPVVSPHCQRLCVPRTWHVAGTQPVLAVPEETESSSWFWTSSARPGPCRSPGRLLQAFLQDTEAEAEKGLQDVLPASTCAGLAKPHSAGQVSLCPHQEETEALADGLTGSVPTVSRFTPCLPVHLRREILATLPSELDPGWTQKPGRWKLLPRAALWPTSRAHAGCRGCVWILPASWWQLRVPGTGPRAWAHNGRLRGAPVTLPCLLTPKPEFQLGAWGPLKAVLDPGLRAHSELRHMADEVAEDHGPPGGNWPSFPAENDPSLPPLSAGMRRGVTFPSCLRSQHGGPGTWNRIRVQPPEGVLCSWRGDPTWHAVHSLPQFPHLSTRHGAHSLGWLCSDLGVPQSAL